MRGDLTRSMVGYVLTIGKLRSLLMMYSNQYLMQSLHNSHNNSLTHCAKM
jgi:hypothetical protein